MLYQDRWQQLESYRCNVSIEFDNLRASIDRPPPIPKQFREKKPGFYPKTFSDSFNLVGEPSWYETRTAFNVLRTLEDGGAPSRCGNFVHSSAIFDAARWISAHSEFLSLSSILRVADNDKNNNYFSFIRVATFKIEHINYLLASTFCFLDLNFWTINNIDDSRDAYIRSCLTILSCICFRLSETLLEQLLEFSVKAYKHVIFHKNLWYFDSFINTLFESIFYSLSDEKVFELLPKLLEIPLIESLDAHGANKIKDPFLFIRTSSKKYFQFKQSHPNYDIYIDKIILSARSNTSRERESAIYRLVALHKLNLLTDTQKEKFSTALWSKLDNVTQLPLETGLFNFGLLSLPQPEIGLAKDRIKIFLLNTDFPKIFNTLEEDGLRTRSTSGLESNQFREICDSTVDVRCLGVNESERLEWNSEEILVLSDKLIQWWNSEKNDIDSALSLPIAGSSIEQCFCYINKIFAVVILPRLSIDENKPDLKVAMQDMLVELDDKDLLKKTTLPSLLLNNFEKFNYDKVVEKIKVGLLSSKREAVVQSIYGILDWILLSETCNLEPPPEDLLDEVVSRVHSRNLCGLDAAMEATLVLLPKYPSVFKPEHINSLISSLEYLLVETRLPNLEELDIADEATYRERPEYRRLASELAFQLYLLLEGQKKSIPKILDDWKNESKSDVFPEVRKIWQY